MSHSSGSVESSPQRFCQMRAAQALLPSFNTFCNCVTRAHHLRVMRTACGSPIRPLFGLRFKKSVAQMTKVSRTPLS